MQITKGSRLIFLTILACQLLLFPSSIDAQTYQNRQEITQSGDTHQTLRDALATYATENPAFQEGLEVYWQFLETTPLKIRDITELDGKGSSMEEVLEHIETTVKPEQYSQNDQESYLLYVFDVPAGDNTSHHHMAEIIVYFTDDHLEYVGLSSVTMNFDAKKVLSEEAAIAASEPGTKFEALVSLEPVFVGVSHSRFKGETYTSLSFPSFAGFDDLMYEFSLFNQQYQVVYNFIVNTSSRTEQPSSYLFNLSQEYYKQTLESNDASLLEDTPKSDASDESKP